jgi:hypothetical protein
MGLDTQFAALDRYWETLKSPRLRGLHSPVGVLQR